MSRVEEPFIYRVLRSEAEVERFIKAFKRPPDLDVVEGHAGMKWRVVAWGDRGFLEAAVRGLRIYHVNRSPIPVRLEEPTGLYAQSMREGGSLFHCTANPRIIMKQGKLIPRHERLGYYSPAAYVCATTNPWRYNAPFAGDVVLINRWVFRIRDSDVGKFHPVIYKLTWDEKWIEKVRRAGYRIMTADEVLDEYGEEWWIYEYHDAWIDENEWRSMVSVEVEYVGRKDSIRFQETFAALSTVEDFPHLTAGDV